MGVPLIPQTNEKGCWYASTQMLIQWRRGRSIPGDKTLDPSEDRQGIAWPVAIGDVSGLLQGMANRFGCKVRGFGEWLAWSYAASGEPTGLMAPRSVVANLKDGSSKKGVYRSLKDLFSHYQKKVIECSPEQKPGRVK
jgi:hypothetical protein